MNRRTMLLAMGGAALPLYGVPGRSRPRGSLSLAHRVPDAHWMSDERFALLLKSLNAHRGAVDEIAFSEGTELWTPLEEIERRNGVLKKRIAALKEAGWSAGVNVGVTMGHGDTSDPGIPPLPFPATVGHDGKVSKVCPCPNSPQYRAYIAAKYRSFARANPDFIWMDDDLRASHHGPTYPCFCPICLRMFGRGADLAELVGQLNAPENCDLRRAWTEFRAASLESLCADVRRAIEQVNPAVEIGLMTIGYSHSTYGGYAIHRWMQALGARRGRPGHGYYTDQAPRTRMLDKAMDVGRQVRDYPAAADVVQYELEDYPHIPLDKSVRTVINECTAALMMGCNGIAFTLLPFTEVGFEDYDRVMDAIAAEKPAWEALLKETAGLPLVGFWPADNRMLMANRKVAERGWFWEHGVYEIQEPNETVEMGLPLTTDPKSACGVLLAGKVAEAFSKEELRGFLSKAVLMDGFALEVLWERGLGELTGVKPGRPIPGGVTERLTAHTLNGRYAGGRRDILAGPADGVRPLTPVSPEAGDLAHLVLSDGSDAGCCFSTFTNPLGGRVAVSTFGPWHRHGRSATRHRLLAVADWLANGRLPVIIDQTVRTAPLMRMSPDGKRFALLLVNTALDPTGPLTLRLRAQPGQVTLIGRDKAVPLRTARENGATLVRLSSVPAWQTAILVGS